LFACLTALAGLLEQLGTDYAEVGVAKTGTSYILMAIRSLLWTPDHYARFFATSSC